MKPIMTLTMNPSVDVAWEVDEMVPIRKMRASPGRADPGGGGINAARVISTLGGEAMAVYLAGGRTGDFLDDLLEARALKRTWVRIGGLTRMVAMAFERETSQEYRIVPPGPELAEAEWRSVLDLADTVDCDYFIATGSLPPGAPSDFYAQLATRLKARGIKVIVDTSGRALFEALKAGVHLVKPNQRELELLTGRKATSAAMQAELCQELVTKGWAEIVALTLGEDGAVLAHKGGIVRLPSPKVEVKSAVGAGDSFVGGMTLGLAQGRSIEDAFALGVATGAATVLTAGTELCRRDDVERLYTEVQNTASDTR